MTSSRDNQPGGGGLLMAAGAGLVASFAWWRGFAALRGGLVAAITQDWLQVGVAV